MSLNTTQIISSPVQIPKTPQPFTAQNQPTERERECWNICRDRFKSVILFSVAIQYLLLLVCAILLFNISFLHPVFWFKETFAILCSPLMLVTVIHGYFKLKPFIEEGSYRPTRFSKLITCFSHESTIFTLNLLIGLFTSLIFLRLVSDDFRSFAIKTEEKRYLNEKFAFILLNGVFVRCYFFLKRRDSEQHITAPVVHQSKFLQLRRQFVTVIRSSMAKSLMPTFYFLGYYAVFGGIFTGGASRLFRLNQQETSILDSFAALCDLKLLGYSWILSCLMWCNMELVKNVIDIYVSQPKQFTIEAGGSLTLSDAISIGKFKITQQLACQDLALLADNPNGTRRKQLYSLSNPGGHPHNWKILVQKTIEVISKFSGELMLTVDNAMKNNNSITSSLNQPINNFYEAKRMNRQFNETGGVRSLNSLSFEPTPVEKKFDYVAALKNKLLSYRIVFFFFGEPAEAKLNFLLYQHAQNVANLVQGLAAIVARSIHEDSYGVVQQDIKQIVKSFIKLKSVLDKVGTVSVIAKDRSFLSLKAATRRSLYRITSEFSAFFDELLLDPEDLRALHSFVMMREL